MVRTLKVSHKKLLAFFIAFAVALLAIGGVLPSIAKAGTAGDISKVDITIGTMPEVGKTAGSVMEDNDISFVTNGTQAIERYDSVAITVLEWVVDETDPRLSDYQRMDPDDVFEKDGEYKLSVLIDPVDAAKIAENPYVTINGLQANWDTSTGLANFYMEFVFSTVNYDSDGGTAVASESVIMGNYFTEPAEPTKEGYVLRGWWFDDELAPARKGWYVFNNEPENLKEITLTAKWAPAVSAGSGDNQTFYLESGDDVTVKWDMNYNYFYHLELLNTSTGEYVYPENGVDYEVKEGSTIVTFTNSFLKTLEAGKYEVRAWFNEGNDNVSVGKATLVVNEGVAPSTTPQTGDNANIATFVSIGLVAIAGIATVVFVKRRVNE